MSPSHKRPFNLRPLSCKLPSFCFHGDEPHKRDPIFQDHFCCKQSSIPLKLWDATVVYACTFSLISHYHVATGLCNVYPSQITHYHVSTGLCSIYPSQISHYHVSTVLYNCDPSLKSPVKGNNLVAIFCVQCGV